MFFRLKETKSGKAIQLVHNYRVNDKVKQKVILSLGNSHIPKSIWKKTAQAVEMRLNGEESLFPLTPAVAKWTDRIVERIERESRWQSMCFSEEIREDEDIADGVLIDRIEHENETEAGKLLVLHKAWEDLELDRLLSGLGFNKKQKNAAMVSIFNRLIEPVSENELSRWCSTLSFDDIYADNISEYSKDTYYRVSDKLLQHSSKIQKHLIEKEEELFNLDRSIILYDLTNTYFEGGVKGNSKAKRGHSKEKRSDCPLVSIGIVTDSKGFIIDYKIFEGNKHDSHTLIEIINELESRNGKKEVVILDGGIASADNLSLLTENGYNYIVAGKRQSRKDFYDDFCNDDAFSLVSDRKKGKEVEISKITVDNEEIILCKSLQRKQKEDAILSKYEEKFLTQIESLNQRVQNPKSHLKTKEKIERAIGKLNAQYTRASKFYEVIFDEKENRIKWERLEDKYIEAKELNGCYFLRSSFNDISPEEIWKCYISLTRVEHAFEMMKSFLGLRPVRHHREDRCEAHIFITIIAYHIMCYIEERLKEEAMPITWWNLRRTLETHCYSTVIIPTKDKKVRTIRKIGRPCQMQRKIYEVLNINYKNTPVYKRIFSEK